jgi:hypothetical protein
LPQRFQTAASTQWREPQEEQSLVQGAAAAQSSAVQALRELLQALRPTPPEVRVLLESSAR